MQCYLWVTRALHSPVPAALGRNQPKPQMLSGDNVPGMGARPWGAEGLSSREGELGPST